MKIHLLNSLSRITQVVTIVLLLFNSNIYGQSTFPVSIREGLANGQITMTTTPFNEADINNIFNGHLNDWVRSSGLNPMIVTLQFSYEFTITETSAYVHYPDSGVWSVESASTMDDLDGQTGSYKRLVNSATYTPYTVVSRPVNAVGRVLRLTVKKQASDNYVHISEWGITATGKLPPSTCNHKGVAPWELWVSNVQFNTINNTSAKFKDYATLGYSNFTNLSTTVAKGQNYQLTVTPGLSWSGILLNTYSRVWIDYNGNNTFESSEMVFQNTNTNSFSGNFNIPLTAITGNVKMRVAMKWGGYPDPCETFDKGEVEDYSLQITEGSTGTMPDLALSNLNLSTPSVMQGRTLRYAIDVKNIGKGNVTGNFTLKAYISTDAVLSSGDIQDGVISLNNQAAEITAVQVGGFYNVPAGMAAGQYFLILKVDADNQITESNENNNVYVSATSFNVYQGEIGYCTPTLADPAVQWIEQVSVSSPAGNTVFPVTLNDRYRDFTNLNPVTIQRGQTTVITISPKTSSITDQWNSNMYWSVWIDFNTDKDFNDPNELVIGRKVNYQSGVFLDNYMSFVVPTTAALGTTRLRVAMKPGALPTPCDVFGVVEIEDYAVNIVESADTSCRYQDSLQLVRLFNATNGATWTNKWNLNTPINTWYGITLNVDGCVTGINLENNTIVGTVPNLSLPHLTFFNMRNNVLSGTIPNFNFPNLTVFILAANKFEGTIPNFNFPNLEFLWLYGNQLTGTPPNFNFPKLTSLILVENQFTGTIPNFNFPLMKNFALSYNNFSGTIPNFNFPLIETFYLDNNQLTGSIPNFNFPKVTVFQVASNQLSGTIPNFNFPLLKELGLNSNQLTGAIPSFNFPEMERFWLDHNQLSGCIPLALKTFCGKTVDISNNPGLTTQDFNAFCSNNTGSCSPPLQPDLTLNNLNLPTPSVSQGSILSYFFDLKNIGTGNASGNFTVKAYISKDNILSADDIQDGIVPTGNFDAGFYVFQVSGASIIAANIAAGQYFLILKVDADNQITESDETNNTISTTFEVTALPGVYCSSKGTFPWEQWIGSVSIAPSGFRNVSGKDGYGNFTNLTGATLKRNVGNFITISPESSWPGNPLNANMYWRVWVDLNGDNDFNDAGEMLISRNVTISNGVFLDNEASFFIPATAKLGRTRLRVAMKAGGVPEPCEVFERGEVEDYTVDIIEEPAAKRDTLRIVSVSGAKSVRQGEQITLNVTIKNTGTAPSSPSTPLSIYQNQQPFIFKGPPPTYLTIVSERTSVGRTIQPNESVTIPVTVTMSPTFSHISRPDYTGVQYNGTYLVIGNRSNSFAFYPYSYPVLDTLAWRYDINAILDYADLKIEIEAPDTTYKKDGKHSYTVIVTNIGSVVAKDIIANVGSGNSSFNSGLFKAPTVTPQWQNGRVTYATPFGGATYALWNIDLLTPNQSISALVQYDSFVVSGTFPEITNSVSVNTNHIIDTITSNNTASKHFILDTTPVVNTGYCEAKGTYPWEQWISHVYIQSSAGAYSYPQTVKEGYGNFTSAAGANMYRGWGGLLSIVPNSSWVRDPRNQNMYWRVWIDFNNDNDFDDEGEMVISDKVTVWIDVFMDNNRTLFIPASVPLGKKRMRIAMKVGGYPIPCETFERGEVEDYAINILEATSATQALVVQGDLSVLALENKVRMDWVQQSPLITSFDVEKSTDRHNFERITSTVPTLNNYHIAYDNDPTEGVNYYRLKMYMSTGEALYSSIKKVWYEKLADFTIFPNPASDEAYIDLKKYEGLAVQVSISDLAGKIIAIRTVENATIAPLQMDLANLKNGSYLILVKSKNKRDVVRKIQVLR